MHSDECSFEGVVEGIVVGVSDGEVANEVEAFTEVSVPELVASGESFEGTLVDDETLLEGRFRSSDEVTPP